MFCPNTDTKFREPYHLNHVIPRLDIIKLLIQLIQVFIKLFFFIKFILHMENNF